MGPSTSHGATDLENNGGWASESEASKTCDKITEKVVVNMSRDTKSFEFLPVIRVRDAFSARPVSR